MGNTFSRMKEFALFIYDISHLPILKKQSFTHSLYGTGGRKPTLKEWNGIKLGKNSFLVPLKNKGKVEHFLNKWNVNFFHIVIYLSPHQIKKLETNVYAK